MSFSYEEALTASTEYFNGDQVSAKIFLEKYALKDNEGNLLEKTPTDMHWRMAKEFARIESNKFKTPLTAEEIFTYFDKFKYIVPQGCPMSGIGNKYQIQSLGNCFVVPPMMDSYAGILYTDQQQIQLYKRRSGAGSDISNLRPKGLPTNNAAKTTDGIGVFMERISNSCLEVAQSGRRGASLISISIHHPEIETFIKIKQDKTKVNGSNISVRVSDEFMKAVQNDSEYEQRWPVDSKKPTISKMVKARDIWNLIVQCAWSSGDPGLMFWDTAIRESLPNRYKEIDTNFADTSSNPCLPKWAKLLTPTGIKELKDINIGDQIWSETGWTTIVNKWSTGIKKVYKYSTTFGEIYTTEDHRIVSKGIKIPISQSKNIDILIADDINGITWNLQTVVDGFVLGDGSVHRASNNKVYLDIGKKDYDYFTDEVKTYVGQKNGIGRHSYDVKTTLTYNEVPRTWERKIPERIIKGSIEEKCSFLRGLYTANGSIVGGRITLKATSFNVIMGVQLILSSLGIASYYTTNKPVKIKFSNGEYLCKESYDLNITRIGHQKKFTQLIGFIQKYKNEKLQKLISKEIPNRKEKNNVKITKNEFFSEEEVFDITVNNNTHTFWCNGFNISNCGEIIQGFDSCRLITMNLYSYVTNPFTEKAKFNFELFAKHTEVAQRLMDDLVDLEQEAMDKIIQKIKSDPEPIEIKQIELDLWKQLKKNCANGRRTGLGITALADVLAALNIKYGTDEAIKKTEKIYKQLAISSMRSSCLMAKELGAFPLYNKKVEENHPFLQRLFKADPELETLHNKYGRRNISLTTTSPNGTVSILMQTSSGIEPVFFLSYKRNKKITDEKNSKISFTDAQGIKWETFDVFHPKLKEWMQITGETDLKKSPYYGATANDIDYFKSVETQATAQKWITHSISKTHNLNKKATKNMVEDIYLHAYKTGCKGVTVYRDGSKGNVIESNVTSKEECKAIIKTQAPKRPKSLPCDLLILPNKKSKILIIVGKLNNDPYEVFAMHTNDENLIAHDKQHGTISKVTRGHYIVKTDKGEVLIKDTHKALEPEEAAITRLISASLRHGADVAFIVHQLEKVEGDWNSFAKAIARVLKSYVVDGTKVTGEECPTCNSTNLARESGCIMCKDCGWSKCS